MENNTIKKLDNGSAYYYTACLGAPRLAVSFLVPSGYLLDPILGTHELFSRLLLKGTQTRTQEQLSLEIDSLTLDIDTTAKRDYIGFHTTFLEEDLDAVFALVSDMFFQSTFIDLPKEIQKLTGEILMELDSPKASASDLFLKTVWQDTSYSGSSSQLAAAIAGISHQHMTDLHQSEFHPGNLTIVATGASESAKIEAAVQKYFPASQATENNSALLDQKAAGPVQKLNQLQIVSNQLVSVPKDDSSQAHIFKGWLMPSATDADYPAIALMNTILGAAGLTSRLFLELRDKQGLAYHVRSTYEGYKHKGIFYLYIGTEPANKQKCLDGFQVEVDKIINTLVPADELADAKRNWLGRRSISLETAPQLTSYLSASLMIGRSVDFINTLEDRINAVTPDDIQRVAQHWLTRPAVISVAAPSSVL